MANATINARLTGKKSSDEKAKKKAAAKAKTKKLTAKQKQQAREKELLKKQQAKDKKKVEKAKKAKKENDLVYKYLKNEKPKTLKKIFAKYGNTKKAQNAKKRHELPDFYVKKYLKKAQTWKKNEAKKKAKAKAAAKKRAEAKKKAAAAAAAKRRKRAAALKKIKSKIAAAEKAGRMEIHLINITKAIDLQIPVLPDTFQVSDKQNNETAVVHTTGEVTLLGKTGLREISLESYFPAKKPRYISGTFHSKPYSYYVTKIKSWKDAGNICEVHITLTNIAWQCTIEEFTFSEEGSTGDINYTISLKEYKSPVGRVTKKTKTTKHTVKKKETLKKIAKKYLGKTSFSKSIYKQNKKVIEAAWKKHAKKENKKIKAYNRKHPKKKKKLLKLSSGKGKRLAVGTKLIIKQVVVK